MYNTCFSDELEVEVRAAAEFVSIAVALNLAAKFLGLIDSLPYRSQADTLSEGILAEQIKIRDSVRLSQNLRCTNTNINKFNF
jgi:hypothetical protein